MKVLTLSTNDSGGGAAIAALRLHRGLVAAGIEARMAVGYRNTEEPTVTGPRGILNKLFIQGLARLDAFPLLRYPNRLSSPFSTGISTEWHLKESKEFAPDLIHLHWINAGYLGIETVSRLGRPVVWTLHDSWAFTGGCHLPGDCAGYRTACGACPILNSRREQDLSRWVWNRKCRSWRDADMTVVTPSRWLAGLARSSALFHDRRVEVIPNGISHIIFKPLDRRLAREILGFPRDAKLVLFVGKFAAVDPNKGLDTIVELMSRLARTGQSAGLEMVFLGFPPPQRVLDAGLPSRTLGYLHDDVSLSILYSAVDLLLVTSRLENFPNTILEAAACGTPAAAFDVGGIGDLVIPEVTGFLAQPFDIPELADGVSKILRHPDPAAFRANCVEHAEPMEIGNVTRRYLQLYREILAGASPRAASGPVSR